MILIDAPLRWGREPSSHLISDLPGAAGSAELERFAQKLGLSPRLRHRAGTAREHYDVFGPAIERAIVLGATRVDRRRLVEAIRSKRAHDAR